MMIDHQILGSILSDYPFLSSFKKAYWSLLTGHYAALYLRDCHNNALGDPHSIATTWNFQEFLSLFISDCEWVSFPQTLKFSVVCRQLFNWCYACPCWNSPVDLWFPGLICLVAVESHHFGWLNPSTYRRILPNFRSGRLIVGSNPYIYIYTYIYIYVYMYIKLDSVQYLRMFADWISDLDHSQCSTLGSCWLPFIWSYAGVPRVSPLTFWGPVLGMSASFKREALNGWRSNSPKGRVRAGSMGPQHGI